MSRWPTKDKPNSKRTSGPPEGMAVGVAVVGLEDHVGLDGTDAVSGDGPGLEGVAGDGEPGELGAQGVE